MSLFARFWLMTRRYENSSGPPLRALLGPGTFTPTAHCPSRILSPFERAHPTVDGF